MLAYIHKETDVVFNSTVFPCFMYLCGLFIYLIPYCNTTVM